MAVTGMAASLADGELSPSVWQRRGDDTAGLLQATAPTVRCGTVNGEWASSCPTTKCINQNLAKGAFSFQTAITISPPRRASDDTPPTS